MESEMWDIFVSYERTGPAAYQRAKDLAVRLVSCHLVSLCNSVLVTAAQ